MGRQRGVRGPTGFRVILAALAVLFGAAACSDSNGGGGLSAPADSDPVSEIALDVRVHLLESDEFAQLSTTLTGPEVGTLFEGVNEIWAEAGIRWVIESIVREPAANQDLFGQVIRGEIPFTGSVLASLLPRERLLAGKWDVFMIRDLGGSLGGVYIGGIPAVVGAELDPLGGRDLASAMPRIVAHELGHSIGLAHVDCVAAGNLMAPGCFQGVRTRLTASQTEIARSQASTGRPF
jgi:hypothetical protein